MSAQHLTKDICLTRDIPREMLCGHSADIYLQGYMCALYPSSVFSSALKLCNPVGQPLLDLPNLEGEDYFLLLFIQLINIGATKNFLAAPPKRSKVFQFLAPNYYCNIYILNIINTHNTPCKFL